MFLPCSCFTLLSLAAFIASGHQEPETEEFKPSLDHSQSAIYHCYPEIDSQLKVRKLALLKNTYSHTKFIQQTTPSKFNTLQLGASDSIPASTQPFDHHSPNELTCIKATATSSPRIAKIHNSTCIFSPVVRAGPYYHKEGHPIRQDLAEWQDGLPLTLDIGVIDVNTCKPIQGALVDIWHANATGFYAGHPYPLSGLENEKPQVGGARAGLLTAFPRGNFDEQWLRGAWPTNEDGVAQFSTIFPGYYTGRATHIHAEIHMAWEPTKNGTFKSGEVQYVGQFFFEDELNLSVDKMWPYSQNPVASRTRNWRDSLKVFQESRRNGFHPIVETFKTKAVIRDGLVGFITIGIDPHNSFDHHFNPTASDFDF